MRRWLSRALGTPEQSNERDSPYIDAPVWPWSLAGWSVGGLMVLYFFVAWVTSREVAVLDVVFVGLAVVFFAVAVGYIAVCDRLMSK
jgi:succinate-acetate transporter protein